MSSDTTSSGDEPPVASSSPVHPRADCCGSL
uniref:Uncharacterized protein n=1 Tax=Arundo donax TaxID=35708 RepID=A0A0A9AKS9_ARUDO